MNKTRFLLALLLVVWSLPAPGRPKPKGDPVARKLDEMLSSYSKLDIFSGTVLVAHKGKVLYSGAFGEANKDLRFPNRLNTRFNVGPLGMTFTAVAVMQLVQGGNLALNDPLGKFLPDCPFPQKDRILVQHLLNHTSGLGSYQDLPGFEAKMRGLKKIGDVLPLLHTERPWSQPGEGFRFSTSGMVLLGAIIEKVSGLTYPEYLKKNILDPLGMSDSGLFFAEEVVPNRAIGYLKQGERRYESNVFVSPPPFSDGGLTSTAQDLARYDRALQETRLLSETSKLQMLVAAGVNPAYALGWEVGGAEARRYVGHRGSAPGASAELRRYLDSGLFFVVLSNYSTGATLVAPAIEAILFGQPLPLPTPAEAVFDLGLDLIRQDRLQDAQRTFARNLSAEPPHVPSLYQSARCRIVGGFELEAAIQDLDRYIQLAGPAADPPARAAWWRRAAACEKLGKTDEAIRSHEKVLELEPKNLEAKKALDRLKSEKQRKQAPQPPAAPGK